MKIRLTEAARERLTGLMEHPRTIGMRLWVRAWMPDGPAFALDRQEEGSVRPGECSHEIDGIALFTPSEDVDAIDGATIDFVTDQYGTGFRIDRAPLDGYAGQIEQVLSGEVNPGLAAHGGQVVLVGVREGTVFVRMEGGCRGCGCANVTLQHIVERKLKERCDHVKRVVDVTDHSYGGGSFEACPF